MMMMKIMGVLITMNKIVFDCIETITIIFILTMMMTMRMRRR